MKLTEDGITENSALSKMLLYQYTTRKSFIKVENLLKRSPVNFEYPIDSAPRLIQGGSPEFIALVGPWFMAVQDLFKRRWDKRFFLCFSSGMTAKQAADYIVNNNSDDMKFMEDDLGKFDSSISKKWCEYELWLMKKFGCPKAVYDLWEVNISTHGVTTHGWRYKVKGTRKSGDPPTSVFNSIINGLAHAYIYCLRTGRRCVDVAIRAVAQDGEPHDVTYHFKMLLQGDDNVTAHQREFDVNGNEILIDWRSDMGELGFDSEAVYRDRLTDITFCSMTLVYAGGWVFIPQIGRLLSKFGYCIDRPLSVEPKQMLRGIALGLKPHVHFVPVLRALVERTLELTEGSEAYFDRRDYRYHKLLASSFPFQRTAELDAAIYDRYLMAPTQVDIVERQIMSMSFGDKYPDTLYQCLCDRDVDAPTFIF
jgi:hypothetical protein